MKKVNMIFREKKPLFWMALAFVMMIGVLSLCVWPLFSRLSADQALWQDLMRHPLLAQGAMSVVMALQVVLAFLPGDPDVLHAADRYPLLLISAHHRSCAHPFHHHEHDGGIDVSHGRIWDHGGGAGDNGASVIGRTVAVPIHLCA